MAKTPFCALLAVALAVLSIPAAAQYAAVTAAANLNQLTDRAALIVRGTVMSAHVEKHPEFGALDTVVVRLRVKESFKGQATGVHTFRQYIWDVRDIAASGGYQKGQDLLLMLIEPSRFGLSSPAGLEQGRFQIRRDAAGREVAANGRANHGLFDDMVAQTASKGIALSARSQSLVARQPAGPVELRALGELIRELAAGSP